MPAYDYDCAACGTRFEVVHGVYADPPTICPVCGSVEIRKAISAPAIHYKGSGWAKKERHASASSKSSRSVTEGSTGDSGPSDGGSTDAKPAGDIPASDAPSKPAKTAKSTETATASTTD